MTKPLTTLDYGRRIERVIRAIADRLDAPLDLDGLASVACFSPCHFHRIYRGVTGETVAETVRRLRLARAAAALVQGREPIPAIARRAGYGSVAAFTRAFRAAHGLPPATYRKQGRLVPPAPSPHPQKSAMYDVQIRTLPPLRLAGLRHTGPYMDIGPVFDRLFAWAGPRGLLGPATRSFGIYYDDPAAVPAAKLRSDACIALEEALAESGEVKPIALAGGRHAVILHVGPYAELEGAYRWLYATWLPQSGMEAGDRPCFEEYLNDPRAVPPAALRTEVFLPLA